MHIIAQLVSSARMKLTQVPIILTSVYLFFHGKLPDLTWIPSITYTRDQCSQTFKLAVDLDCGDIQARVKGGAIVFLSHDATQLPNGNEAVKMIASIAGKSGEKARVIELATVTINSNVGEGNAAPIEGGLLIAVLKRVLGDQFDTATVGGITSDCANGALVVSQMLAREVGTGKGFAIPCHQHLISNAIKAAVERMHGARGVMDNSDHIVDIMHDFWYCMKHM
jgi:hypothetical protein